MNHQDYEAILQKQALHAKEMRGAGVMLQSAAGSINSATVSDASPIERKLNELNSALGCAHEGMEMLMQKLAPVRAICPTGVNAGDKSSDAACEIEQRLQYLIDSASALSRKLSDLRGELRI